MSTYRAGKSRAAISLPVLILAACGGGGGGGSQPATYAVGGTVTGLNAAGLELANGATSVTVPSGATTFTFAKALPSGTPYAVSVLSQPSDEACHIMNGNGSINGGAVTGIKVSCGIPTFAALAGNFGGAGNADGAGPTARFNLQTLTTIIDPLLDVIRTFVTPGAVATDSLGNVYVADSGNNTIRKITAEGAVTTLAGTAGPGGSADGTGSAARFSEPTSVGTDGAGNIFVADSGSDTIRRITPAGVVTTFAGTAGSTGSADGTGAAASFNFVHYYDIPTLGQFVEGYGTVATDIAGNVYVGDCGNFIVRKISPAAVVTTIAGQAGIPGSVDSIPGPALFGCPDGLATDGGGNIYVADTGVADFSVSQGIAGNDALRKITPAGVVTTVAGVSGGGVAADNLGNVYVADSGSGTIDKIAPTGSVTTLAGMPGTTGSADGLGGAATFNAPASVALDRVGNIFVADSGNNTIRKITPVGVVTTFAGAAVQSGNADGTGAAASFSNPVGLAADAGGNVYVADTGNDTIRKIMPGGVVTSLKGTVGPEPWNLAADGAGNLYVVAAGAGAGIIQRITAAGVVTTFAGAAANFAFSLPPLYLGQPWTYAGAVATDAAGNVYVADTFNETIRKITPAGTVTTLAGTFQVKGHADGTGAAAEFLDPQGIATDSGNNVFVADTGNNTIRKITSAGVVTTLAGAAGTSGSADGSGSAASFNGPTSLAADESGNIYVADTGNDMIRKITPAGVVTTVVGMPGIAGFTPGPLPGVISHPLGIAISGTSLYVTSENGVAVVEYFP
jgi:sugar lactone lactonase YvrE